MLTGELCDESKPYFVAFRSEFVVSRARLLAQPLATYQKLHSYVGVRPRPWPTTFPDAGRTWRELSCYDRGDAAFARSPHAPHATSRYTL